MHNMARVMGLLLTVALSGYAEAGQTIDCPHRDDPFSLESPLIDILLNTQAKSALQQALPGALDLFPADMLRTETPSFAAIMSINTLAHLARLPAHALAPLALQLAEIPVTDEDRALRCARYSDERPPLNWSEHQPNVLVFRKINGFDHGPSVDAADAAIRRIGLARGWHVVVTDQPGVFNAEQLGRIDAVVWNNNSGDVLTLTQRAAFERYIEAGGSFLGLHGAGGDFGYSWPWYRDELLGAQFIGHPMEPQFQDARLAVEVTADGIGQSVAPGWTMNDEWYSFARTPRATPGVNVITTIDETSYTPVGMGGQDLRMGEDHPIVWRRCVKAGRAAYSAIGHRSEVYQVSQYDVLLGELLDWVIQSGQSPCALGD